MTLAQFGREIGFGSSAIANVESGTNNLSTQMFTAIVQRYGVSPEWLRDGVGDPFPPRTRDQEFADLIASAMAEPEGSMKVRLLRALAKMTPEDWEYLEQLSERVLEEQNGGQN